MLKRAGKGTLGAVAIFAVTMAAASVAYYQDATPPWLLRMTSALAYSSSAILNVVGLSTAVVAEPQIGPRPPSYTVHGGGTALNIAIDCNGFWAFAIFVAAVFAVPSSFMAKIWGIGLGVPALWVINTLRIVSLYFISIYAPRFFEAAHLYVWQYLIIAAAFGLLLLWAEYFTRPADA